MNAIIAVIALSLVTLAAQAPVEPVLRQFFEGKRVIVKMDMPATSDGVDVLVGATPSISSEEYGKRIRRTGIAIKAGETIMVTRIRVKEKLIEFQLGGGGYGAWGDESASSVYVPSAGKSSREKSLEQDLKRENDPARRRDMERELNRLRRDRESEDRHNRAVAAVASEAKKARIQEARLQAGSRFNIRYPEGVPPGITSEDIMSILAECIAFPSGESRSIGSPSDSSITRSQEGLIWKGMSLDQAERALGAPVGVSERMEGSLKVRIVIFVRVDQHIKAEFVEGVLVRYAITSK